MNAKPKPPYLDEAVQLLVRHFGIDRVRAALARISKIPVEAPRPQAPFPSAHAGRESSPNITLALEDLHEVDREKHRVLADFYSQLKNGKVLPEPQDIRQFAQIIGLKEIHGKSRKDLLPKLVRFLMDLPRERIQAHISTAQSVSEEQRKQGFSVLTDKLLGTK